MYALAWVLMVCLGEDVFMRCIYNYAQPIARKHMWMYACRQGDRKVDRCKGVCLGTYAYVDVYMSLYVGRYSL